VESIPHLVQIFRVLNAVVLMLLVSYLQLQALPGSQPVINVTGRLLIALAPPGLLSA
jgi:hypothetical protein